MRTLLPFFAGLMMVLTAWSGMAHAAEAAGCRAAPTFETIGHIDGDSDQTPGDGENGTPHHHAGCHGHHVGTATGDDAVKNPVFWQVRFGRGVSRPPEGHRAVPALRPPQP